jgi:hypothetical protein
VKVKELIRLLQEEDPESEACVHNADIESVYAAQAYWDGRLQMLERDAEGYVIGGKYTSKGWKVNICPSSITEQIWGDPEFKVDYSELGGSAERYIESDNKTRQASRDVIRKVAMGDSIAGQRRRPRRFVTATATSVIRLTSFGKRICTWMIHSRNCRRGNVSITRAKSMSFGLAFATVKSTVGTRRLRFIGAAAGAFDLRTALPIAESIKVYGR